MAPYNQLPDSATNRGLWAQTATIDWCESNYELSYYIAEFWNTISNLAFIMPQLAQYIALAKHKNVEPSFRRAFLSLALVGIGSFCFHMTLAKPMQMFDETSMIVVTLHGFYLLYIIKQPDVNRQKLASLLVCYGLVFVSLYVFLVDWPIFHHTVFGILVYASVAIGYQLKRTYGPHYKFWTVLILQHLAFVFWLIDKHYCEVLTQFREHLPSLVRPVLQFHALWHLLMGLGSYIFICGMIRLRAWTKYKEEFVISYQWFGLWITLTKVSQENSPLASMEKQQRQKLLYHQQKQLYEYKQSHEAAIELNYRRKQQTQNQQPNSSGHQYDLNQNQVHYQ